MAIANPKPSPVPQEWAGTAESKTLKRTRYECDCGAWCNVPEGHEPAFLEMHEEHEDSWLK